MPITNPVSTSGLTLVTTVNVAANTNSVNISSTLDLDAAKFYLLVGTIKNVKAGSNEFGAYVNNDTTGTNYYCQYLLASSSTVASNRVNLPRITEVAAQNDAAFIQCWIKRDIDGRVMFNCDAATRDATNITKIQYTMKWTTVANMTRLDIVSLGAGDNIGAGSTFHLFKVV